MSDVEEDEAESGHPISGDYHEFAHQVRFLDSEHYSCVDLDRPVTSSGPTEEKTTWMTDPRSVEKP